MAIKSLIAALIIYLIGRFLINNKQLDIEFIDSAKMRVILISISILFLLCCYLIPASYYYPHNNGVLGDNYLHLYWAFGEPGFLKPHHPLFPLIPEKFLRILISTDFLSLSDPLFLEKAYYWSVFPVSLSIILALILFFKAIIRKGLSNRLGMSIFLLYATSFGIWIWALHSNAIGLSIAMQLFIATVFINWYASRKLYLLVLIALLIGTSIFLYNGLVYYSFGSFLAVIWVLISEKGSKMGIKIKHSFVFSGVLVLMAIGYYFLEAHINHTYILAQLFNKLAETDYLGGFESSNYLSSMESNFKSGLNWIVGFYYETKYFYSKPIQYQFRLPIGSNWIKAFQTGALLLIFLMAGTAYFKRKIKPSQDLLILGLINSAIIFIGFTFRMAGTHYYVLALIPNLLLITAFLTGNGIDRRERNIYGLSIFFVVLGSLYFNSFTNLSVFEGKNINDHPYYHQNIEILDVAKGSNATYFKKIDLEYYPNKTLQLYYEDKFKSIDWVTSWADTGQLEILIKEGLKQETKVFLSKEANEIIEETRYHSRKINSDLYIIEQ